MFRELCEKLEFPEESIAAIQKAYDVIMANAKAAEAFEITCGGVLKPNDNIFDENAPIIAEATGLHPYTINVVVQLYCLEPLRQIYSEEGFSEEFFWRLAGGMRGRLLSCYKEHNVWGNTLGVWEWVFHERQCVRLGRLTFEPYPLYCNASYNGVGKGDPIILIHIPSGQPLSIDAVMDSLKQGYEYFKNRFQDGIVPFAAKAWMLYPPYLEGVFSEGGNLQRFASLFHILEQYPDATYKHFPYIFGCSYSGGDFSNLPQKTTLQRNLVAYLQKGNLMGSAFGILFYGEDGIIN